MSTPLAAAVPEPPRAVGADAVPDATDPDITGSAGGPATVPALSDEGATTAEYAITTLAACGFGALLVMILKSDTVRDAVQSIITTALGLGG
jgi:hypothetical protein